MPDCRFIIFIKGNSETENKKFGGLTALTTGFNLEVEEAGDTTVLIDKAKTSGEIITQTNTPIFGIDSSKWNSIALVDGTDHAGFYLFDISRIVPGGIRIGRGAVDSLRAIINDDLTALVDFTIRAIGYKHFP